MITLGTSGPGRDLDWTIQDGLDSVMQRVEQRLRFFRSTWFLDTRRGVQYFPNILTRQADVPLAERTFAAAVEAVEDVEGVESVNVRIGPPSGRISQDNLDAARDGQVRIEVRTRFGSGTVTMDL